MQDQQPAPDFGEPWRATFSDIYDREDATIVGFRDRVVACVNASASYSTEALEGAGVGYFHKAIKEMVDAVKIKDAALEACAAEIQALRDAASCLALIVDHGHAEDCLFLNRANAPCDCGVDQAEAAIAKLKALA